ncbi:anillin-like isoform X1 [Scyliorhinus canicula]|uniref:anillin-like isoform X1 n=1 Tax=Scyliorhinus canicula TaxID=7830 RepID=UPI0018F55D5E|nr:anillin-like isoform X1 [Scyliorhinus canicula]XP_038662978.1 anillin-like isoform X1 [Scyliorhinus canicula]
MSHTVEAMLRGPLKRLRQQPMDNDGGSSELPLDSLKRQKCSFLKEERENVNPVESGFTTSKKFRALEHEIKPDTPVVPSVKSRLRGLAEQRKAWDSDEFSPDVSLGMKNEQAFPEETTNSWKDELTRPAIKKVRKETEEGAILNYTKEQTTKISSVAVQLVRERFEEMNHEKQNQEGIASCSKITAITPSTKAIQEMLLCESTPSKSHVIQMKKEREQELAMLRGKTDGSNPWMGKKTSTSCTGLEQTGEASSVTCIGRRIRKGRGHVSMPVGEMNSEQPPDAIGMTAKETKGSTDSLNNDATSHVEHGEKYEDILRIIEDEGDCKGEAPMDWSTPLRKVTFALEPQAIPSPTNVETESDENEQCISEMELSSQEELNNPEIIDKLFEGVLDSGSMEEELEPLAKEQTMAELKKFNAEEQSDEMKSKAKAELTKCRADDQHNDVKSKAKERDQNQDYELTLPSISMLSPLAKSIKLDAAAPLTAVLSSLNNSLTASCCSPYSSLELDAPGRNKDPVENLSAAVESTAFYSIDLYRTQRRSVRLQEKKKEETKKAIAPQAAENPWLATQEVSAKEKIKILNDEIIRLNSIMHQASQALNCCTDEEHGKGSREEAEAERHLLIASEKRTALLTELRRLKGEDNVVSMGETTQLTNGLEPCRGTITISDLRLPLKAEFVCSALHKQGKPSHYFFLMIRYGPHNIVATPLATAEDAQHGDTITFPTIITLRDIHYKFEIDVEVYSLAQAANVATSEKRRVSRSKVITPKKLLTSITKSSMQSPAASPFVNSGRTSRFVLVGSHKVTLASLGKNKFPLDKMKFDGKVRQLLGDEFQDKVPFLSPLEGAVYLKFLCRFHSTVEHSGFLTMFEDVSGFGAWHRRWFLLSGNTLSYWTYPNEEKHKEPIGCIDLASCTKDKIEPASREFCSRPKTLELITVRPQCDDDSDTLVVKCRNKCALPRTGCRLTQKKRETCGWRNLTRFCSILEHGN